MSSFDCNLDCRDSTSLCRLIIFSDSMFDSLNFIALAGIFPEEVIIALAFSLTLFCSTTSSYCWIVGSELGTVVDFDSEAASSTFEEPFDVITWGFSLTFFYVVASIFRVF